MADGGAGAGPGGGAGGAGFSGALGDNGSGLGGGGGGAGGGGAGGSGATAAGGNGGTAGAPNGIAGQNAGVNGGGGGGGGGGYNGVFGLGGAGGNGGTVGTAGTTQSTTVSGAGGGGGGGGGSGTGLGGNGGAGGEGGMTVAQSNVSSGTGSSTAIGGTGGMGGDGGAGQLVSTAGALQINVTTTGGFGGAGGAGGSSNPLIFVTNGANATQATLNGFGGLGGIGGAGGSGVLNTGNGSILTINSNVGGGAGGVGGVGGGSSMGTLLLAGSLGSASFNSVGGTGGTGGVGGNGITYTGTGTLYNAGSIFGGTGGQGGQGGSPGGGLFTQSYGGGVGPTPISDVPGAGGNGGNGGAGALFTTPGSVVHNTGSIVGGSGGAGGSAGANPGGPNALNGSGGQGGIGLVGNGVTIDNTGGTISGGLATDGVTRAFAIQFTGGTNSVGAGGTINGGIDVLAGSFAPALTTSAIGTPLSISGPVVFASGTTYVVRVSPTASDSLVATGAATLTGATVNAQFTPGSYVSKTYNILTATAGLGGTTFAGLTNAALPSGASDSLSYDATDAYLNLTAGFTNYTGLNLNQQNVANTLTNYFNSTGGIPMRFFGLSPAGLTQIDGEAATGAERGGFRLLDQFLTLMLDPFVDGHFGNDSVNGSSRAMGFAPDRTAELPPDVALAYAKVFTKAPPPPTFDQRWSVWGAGFGGGGKTGGDAAIGSSDTRVGAFGYAGGIDYRLSPATVLGVAVAGGGTNWNLSNGLGNGRSDAFQAGAYGVTRIGVAYLAGSAAFANHWFTTDRTALSDSLHASFTGQVYGGRLESGYRYAMTPMVGVTPYAAVRAMGYHSGAYSEADLNGLGLGLNYGSKDASDVRTELGARLDSPTLLGGMPLILRAKLAYAHDFVDTPSMTAGFQALPGTNFTVFGAPIPHDSALTSLGAEWILSRGWRLLAKFDGEFARDSDLYAGSIALRTSW